ncbi:NADH dehydrogenase (ubiquinone) complex I, assembly factor 6 [Dermatophagoides farinae]|uniref:NADH dehydrogenase (Ubiquinone) complex I, assembly factor 6 n=1 Tax=Dermatophagoides farinae TaxID=6954 RepID=A0A922HYS6_DERFA|nr:squalene/phytoene synthase-like protein [Dermatophagoides farinae]KAH9516588.1 NADH dehydrogenase (ubiquinone) complex I, assembly factor 6 [Dermatophagoides farinae]
MMKNVLYQTESLISKISFFTNSTNQRLSPTEVHCINVVKKFDYENFVATLFISDEEIRRTAFALRAFNVELAQIRDITRTNELAQIRFQFWQDVIDEIYSISSTSQVTDNETLMKYRNFPLAFELFKVLSGSEKLSKHWISKLIQIRRDPKYLGEYPFQTLNELEKYCEASTVSLYYFLNEKSIQLSNEGQKNAGYRIALDHVANHLGKAQGLTNILRGIVHNAKNRRCYIPNDILMKSKCSHEAFLQCQQDNDSLREAIYLIASNAKGHLEHGQKLLVSNGNETPKIQKSDRLIFLPMMAIQAYLHDLQRVQFNVFDSWLYRRRGSLPLKMWWKCKIF